MYRIRIKKSWVCSSCGWVNTYQSTICDNCRRKKGSPSTNVAYFNDATYKFNCSKYDTPQEREYSDSYKERIKHKMWRGETVQTFRDGTPWG